jgi:hypothetical protein
MLDGSLAKHFWFLASWRDDSRRPRDEDRRARNLRGSRLCDDATIATTFFSLGREDKNKERTKRREQNNATRQQCGIVVAVVAA